MFGRQRKEFRALEDELRQGRPRPSRALLDATLVKVSAAGPARRRTRRLGLAVAFVLTVVVVFASFGGLGYAKSATTHAVSSTTGAVTSVVNGNSNDHSSAAQGSSKKHDSSQGVVSAQTAKNGDDEDVEDNDDHGSKPSHDQYEEKVLLCHHPPGNPGKPVTISVGSSAVPAHLKNHDGDHVGACTAADFGPKKNH